MPFMILSRNNKFLLKRLEDDSLVDKTFNTFESALSFGENAMRYRGEIPRFEEPNLILAERRPKIKKQKSTVTNTGGLQGKKRGRRFLRKVRRERPKKARI
jgi:hypothetical protein